MIRACASPEADDVFALIVLASVELERYGTPNMATTLIHLVNAALVAGQPIYVAEEDGEIVGYCAWLRIEGTPLGMITGAGTYVKPKHRKRGLARQMREAATNYWREHEGKYVRGTVASGNEAGRLALEGFRVVGYEVELVL